MKFYGLTTKDNPYDVFRDYINWMNFDHQKGYNTAEYLARIARTSDDLSEDENQKEIERAIDEIIKFHPILKNENGEKVDGIEYVKVVKEEE